MPVRPFTEGPPFFIRPEHYVEMLDENWENLKGIDRMPVESHIEYEHLFSLEKALTVSKYKALTNCSQRILEKETQELFIHRKIQSTDCPPYRKLNVI